MTISVLKALTIHSLLLLSLHAAVIPPENEGIVQQIQWGPCDIDWGIFERSIHVDTDCAILHVPLDYTDTTSTRTLPLHLAKVNATKEPFMGSIVLNPGGPGASGIQDLAFSGAIYNR